MNIQELAARIGTHALLSGDRGLLHRVAVSDAKFSYGKARYEVTPVRGQGSAWVDESSLIFEVDA